MIFLRSHIEFDRKERIDKRVQQCSSVFGSGLRSVARGYPIAYAEAAASSRVLAASSLNNTAALDATPPEFFKEFDLSGWAHVGPHSAVERKPSRNPKIALTQP